VEDCGVLTSAFAPSALPPSRGALRRTSRPDNLRVGLPTVARAEFTAKVGAPDRIRTCGPQLRRLVLYPAELRAPWQVRTGK
jgi:hypothetical protein